MITLIMAAGESSRWRSYRRDDQPLHKPLIEFNGVRLIDRITQQLEYRAKDYHIVLSSTELAKEIGNPNTYLISRTETLAHSILAAKRLWKPTTVILLGDVIYGTSDLDSILLYQSRKLAIFFGLGYETHAVRFHKDPTRLLTNATRYLGRDPMTRRVNEGKLRDLRYFSKFGGLPPLNLDERLDRVADKHFIWLSRHTLDIDHNLALDYANQRKEVIGI